MHIKLFHVEMHLLLPLAPLLNRARTFESLFSRSSRRDLCIVIASISGRKRAKKLIIKSSVFINLGRKILKDVSVLALKKKKFQQPTAANGCLLLRHILSVNV